MCVVFDGDDFVDGDVVWEDAVELLLCVLCVDLVGVEVYDHFGG